MIFALILIIAIAVSFLASPFLAVGVFLVGLVAYLVLAGMKRTSEAGGNASSDPGSHAAQRFRREGRETRTR
jgi:hypothetical protein